MTAIRRVTTAPTGARNGQPHGDREWQAGAAQRADDARGAEVQARLAETRRQLIMQHHAGQDVATVSATARTNIAAMDDSALAGLRRLVTEHGAGDERAPALLEAIDAEMALRAREP